MLKRFFICMAAMFTTLVFSSVEGTSEDIIRYTKSYEMEVQEKDFKPSTEDMQEWWNIDLPRDENNNVVYTLEFDTSKVDFTKEGKYEVPLVFYKRADHKFQKTFELVIKEKEAPQGFVIGDIEKFYIKQTGIVILIGALFYIVIMLLMKCTTKKKKYVVIYNNKIVKTIYSRELLDIEDIEKKTKIKDFSSLIVMNKEDFPKYIEEMTKRNSCDYVIELKK